MSKGAASLGQLAVHRKVIPLDKCRQLRSVLRAHTDAGLPISMGRLLIKGGLSSRELRALLRTGIHLSGVRCDGCDLVIPMAELPERKEYPCKGCGALLLGYAPFVRRKKKPKQTPAKPIDTGRFPEVIRVPSSHGLAIPTPQADSDDTSTQDFDNPDGSTVRFDEILPAQAAPNLDYIYVFPSGDGRVLSENETLMAMERLERDSAEEPNKPGPSPAALPAQRNDQLEESSEGGGSLHAHLAQRELGGFTLIRQIGKGAAGRVFLARERSTQRQVALKVLRTDASFDSELVLRFKREAKIASLVQHPNVVEVVAHGVDDENGVRYLALEYLDGGSLFDLLKDRNQLTETRALEITRGICLALQAAKAHGIVHRDVKPENVLFDSKGVPKLADLGLAKVLEGRTQITGTGFVVGTPCYIAPEQATGQEDVDVRADIFALGFCAWQMLTGVVPFSDREGESLVELILRHVEEDLPDARIYAPTLSPGAAQVVRGMTVRERDRRYLTPAHVIRDIDLVLDGRDPLSSTDPTLPEDIRELVAKLLDTASGSTPAMAMTAEAPPPKATPPEKQAGTGLGCILFGLVGAGAVIALGVWVGLWLHHFWRTAQ